MKYIIIFLPVIFLMLSCASISVARADAEEITDLSGRWNDTDSRLVAEEMILDSLSRPWLSNFTDAEGRAPVVIVGSVSNRSSEHIDTTIFTKDIEREFINSGLVDVVASSEERGEIRDERIDQQSESSLDSVQRLGQETGADYIMIGTISSITDQVDGLRAVAYQVDMELIHIESNRKAWIGSKEIKKIVERSAIRL